MSTENHLIGQAVAVDFSNLTTAAYYAVHCCFMETSAAQILSPKHWRLISMEFWPHQLIKISSTMAQFHSRPLGPRLEISRVFYYSIVN